MPITNNEVGLACCLAHICNHRPYPLSDKVKQILGWLFLWWKAVITGAN